MDLQQIRYVVALADEKHFLRASQKVNISQPTLSQQIKKLEQELGTPLFERAPRRVRLTRSGERFLPYAREILNSLSRGVQDLQEDSGEIRGHVRLAVIPTICAYLIPSLIRDIQNTAPRLILELYEETTSTLLERLKEGETDLGILSGPIHEKGISSLTLGHEKFYLAVSRHHPLAARSRVHPKDLSAEKLLVLQEGHCFGAQSLEYCKRSVRNPQIIFKGSSLLSVMRLAAAGEGVTFVPAMAVAAGFHRDLKFIPFKSPEPTREITAVWRLSSPLLRSHQHLLDCLTRLSR